MCGVTRAAERASIRLERKSDAIVLEIQDQGQGLASNKRISDPNESEELIEMGVGIPGMQQRLRQLGGRLTIDSNSEGTTLIAVVPIVDGTSHPSSTSLASSEPEAAAGRAV
jgi:signal transduction histidine kinase